MYQRFELIGRIGNIEIRYTTAGDPIANMSVATSETYKDKDGNKQENTEWHKAVAFKKLAEVAEKYCYKGQLVFLVGKLRTRKWEDEDGNDRYTTEMIVSELKMLSKKEGAENSESASAEDFDDDIPL